MVQRDVALNGSSTPTIEFGYDPLGRRNWKASQAGVTYYLLDGDEEIVEADDSFNILRRYITGPAVDDRIARAEDSAITNPTKHYYHTNHQGPVIATTNNLGTITQQLAYDEYGNLTSQPPAATTGEQFRYTGRRFDPETGLYYYRARYYSPTLGRFLQTDPVEYKDDFNLYAYVKNDPLNATDPNEEFAVVGFVIGAGIEIGVQTLVEGRSLSEVDYGDVAVAGLVSAVIPGLGNLAKVGLGSAKTVTTSVKAIAKLSEKAANTASRAENISQSIGKNLNKIESAVADAGKAAAVAGVHQAVKVAGQEAAPPMTANSPSTSKFSWATTPAPNPGPLPKQPAPCGPLNTSGCGT
jgi:RHS repeat-associated protein